jgi:hypothetical protein
MIYGGNNQTQLKQMEEKKVAAFSAACLVLFQKGAGAFFSSCAE